MWKFIHNGDGWWLRLTTIDELIEYAKYDNRMATAMDDYIKVKNYGEKHSNLSLALEMEAEKRKVSIMDAAPSLNVMFYQTYIHHINTEGFVNINSNGGCNGIDYKILLTLKKENLAFPHFTEKDIRIKTFKPDDYRENYNYHYYAYLGSIQIKDGDKVKWNSEAEALEFAKKFIE